MDRRQFNTLALLWGGLAAFADSAQAEENSALKKSRAQASSVKAHHDLMAAKDVKMLGNEQIAMLMYPGFTALDLVAPQYLFASMMGAKVYLLSSTNDLTPVMSDTGLAVAPTHTQSECPEHLDILFMPGSANGVVEAMKNKSFIDFIKHKAASTKYLTSVCTGSLLLGQAGLLAGKRATSHWVTLDLLAKFGATPVKERVVWDGNVITGGGVTAGIDFGLQVVAALRGKTYAQALQLQAEYDPKPPYQSGSPDTADVFVKEVLKGMFEPLHVNLELLIQDG